MSALFHILRRDLGLLMLGGRRGGTVLPLLFFLAVAMLFPFAIGIVQFHATRVQSRLEAVNYLAQHPATIRSSGAAPHPAEPPAPHVRAPFDADGVR